MKYIALGLLMIILAACGGDAQNGSNNDTASTNGNFDVQVTGAADMTLTAANARALASDASEEDMTAFNLWFGDSDIGVVSVIFYGTIAPESGEYDISALDFTADEGLDGQVLGLVLMEDADLQLTNAEGNITLENADGVYSGSFAFTVSDPMDEAVTVDVNGTFNDVAADT